MGLFDFDNDFGGRLAAGSGRKPKSKPKKVPPKPKGKLVPVLLCPFCNYRGPARLVNHYSTGTILMVIFLLVVFFPAAWIPLLNKQYANHCANCMSRLG